MSTDDKANVGERLATVEADTKSIKEFMVRIDGKLDAWSLNYVSRNEIQEMFRARDKEIQEVKEDKRSNKQLWPAWAAVVVAGVALLVSIWPH